MASNQVPILTSAIKSLNDLSVDSPQIGDGPPASIVFDNDFVYAKKPNIPAFERFHDQPEDEYCSDGCLQCTGCVLYTIVAWPIVIPAIVCGLIGECAGENDESKPIFKTKSRQVISTQPKPESRPKNQKANAKKQQPKDPTLSRTCTPVTIANRTPVPPESRPIANTQRASGVSSYTVNWVDTLPFEPKRARTAYRIN
ncbi:hypothetical protein [Parashewanella tropica]|uniref:hypothetical protein n=1 Tax=Parashewanella tropica TaxID=2547970 RepID=UPI0010593FB2|nr:hypothetical protein [Parashewanella tropica]